MCAVAIWPLNMSSYLLIKILKLVQVVAPNIIGGHFGSANILGLGENCRTFLPSQAVCIKLRFALRSLLFSR